MDKALLQYLRSLDKDQLIDLFISQMRGPVEKSIPLSIFQAKLSSLELIVKYLKDELNYSNKKIALTLNRTPQNIWLTYRNASKKYPGKLPVKKSEYDFPIDIFTDKRLSMLETIVLYLRKSLSYETIAGLIQRDKKTVITVYHRGMKKLK